MNYKIALFAYDFPHRKTQDFIQELIFHGVNIVVLAAPKVKLAHSDNTSYFKRSIKLAEPLDTRTICKNAGIDFYSVNHDNISEISNIVKSHQLNLGIISGARIITQPIIDLFSEGLVNFHPGMLPETSGLDSFYYGIKKSISLGVTTHFIDSRVDAGLRIAFDELMLGSDDTVEVVQENLYQLQKISLRNFLKKTQLGSIQSDPINRPFKNEPLSSESKRSLIAKFEHWRALRFVSQQKTRLFNACAAGDFDDVKVVLEFAPDLINSKNDSGWTPLIVACHSNHTDLVEFLLVNGADVNLCGNKGTSPLMYAKTPYMNSTDIDFKILDLLLAAGADIYKKDCFGKTVFDYLDSSTNLDLVEYFSRLIKK